MDRKIFLSHSSKDKAYGDALVSLMLRVGLSTKQIIYSSNPNCGIPIGYDIYEYLKEAIHHHPYMLYLLSEHYYDSIACMNEMGAAWVCQNQYLLMATPGFNYADSRFQNGAANPKSLAVQMESKARMREFVQRMADYFQIHVDPIQAEQALQEYMGELERIGKAEKDGVQGQSVKELERVLREAPPQDSFFLQLGKKLWGQDKNYPAAVQQYLYAIYLNEGCEKAYHQIVSLAAQKKDYARGRAVSLEAEKRFPNSPSVYGYRGYLACLEKNSQEAVEWCDKAISMGPHKWFYHIRGCARMQQERLYEALSDFWRACKRDPAYSSSINRIKQLCSRLGTDRLVRAALEKKQEGDRKTCRIYLECVLIAQPGHPEAQAQLDNLEA